MTAKVTIIECDVGNLFSIQQAFRYWGAGTEIVRDTAKIKSAERLLLPGVGAFGDAMAEIDAYGGADAVREYAETGRPLMGICVGMQVLFSRGVEYGIHQGLGLLEGEVIPIPSKADDGSDVRLPHIAWNELRCPDPGRWHSSVLAGVEPDSAVYFAHSFYAAPVDPGVVVADVRVGSTAVTAAVQRDNIVGCQFHPEKSGKVGLGVIKAFLEL